MATEAVNNAKLALQKSSIENILNASGIPVAGAKTEGYMVWRDDRRDQWIVHYRKPYGTGSNIPPYDQTTAIMVALQRAGWLVVEAIPGKVTLTDMSQAHKYTFEQLMGKT